MTIKLVGPEAAIGDEKLRQWLRDWMSAHQHLTSGVIARHTGVSRAQIDRYLAGKYFLPTENGGDGVSAARSKLEPKLRKYKESVEGPERAGYKSTFLSTRAWLQCKQAMETSIGENTMVLVCGAPGSGKSKSLGHFVVEHMTHMVVRVSCSPNVNPKFFVEALCEELKIPSRGSIPRLEKNIIDELRKSPRPVFIDQANFLSRKSLGTCFHVWEETRVPFVLFATKHIYSILAGGDMVEDERAQLTDRISMHYLLDGLSVTEVKTIVTQVLGKAATDSVIAQVMKITLGRHRRVDSLLPRALEIGRANADKLKAGEVSWEEIMTEAGSRLMTA